MDNELRRLEALAARPQPQPDPVKRTNLIGRVGVTATPQGVLLSIFVGRHDVEVYDLFMGDDFCDEVISMLSQARRQQPRPGQEPLPT
jgi:hypothetical protein